MRMDYERKRSTIELLVPIAIGLSLSVVVQLHGSATAARIGVCEREGKKLVGQHPVRTGGSVRAPKKLRDVSPKYPESPPKTVGSGMWLGEVLIGDTGKVAHVWPIREVEFKPPFPAFNNAITDAIRQWEFEPLLVQGKAMPVCMTVTVNINWR